MATMLKKRNLFLLISALVILLSACQTAKDSTKKPLPADVKSNDYKEIITPNNALGFQLLSKVERDNDGNVFISPTSLFMALSMVYNGAEGETKEEMARALQLNEVEAETLNKANASLMNVLQKDEASIQLSIANSVWLSEDFHFQQEFKENTQDYFDAKIEEIDVHDGASADKINDWVSNATNHKIEKMVDAPLNPDLVTYLLNAIYFKGDWLYAFDEEMTRKEDFYLKDGTTKEVPMMSMTEELLYMENELFQAVGLPYDGETMRMNVWVPKENVPMEDFYQTFTLDSWTGWQDAFEKREGTVILPKFTMDYETNLNDVLQQLGMKRAFEKEAEFSKLIEEDVPVWISSVKQKTFIEVNEKGTEAAAVTGVEMVTESAPADKPFFIQANRPFFLTITDVETGIILFMGGIGNPVESL